MIQFTFVDIAQMTSDGEHFRVAVLRGDDKYKRFVKGTNNAIYRTTRHRGKPRHHENDKQKSEKEAVSALSNLRPQHLTDAFMIRPIEPNSSLIYTQSEFFRKNQIRDARRKKALA